MENNKEESSVGTEFINSLYDLLQYKSNATTGRENKVEERSTCNDFPEKSFKKTTDIKHNPNLHYNRSCKRSEKQGKKLTCELTNDPIIKQNPNQFFTSYAEVFYDALESFENSTVNPSTKTKLENNLPLKNNKKDVSKDDKNKENSSGFTSCADQFYDALESFTDTKTEDKVQNVIKVKHCSPKQSKIKNDVKKGIIADNSSKTYNSKNTVDDICSAIHDGLFVSPKAKTETCLRKQQLDVLKGQSEELEDYLVVSKNLSDILYEDLYNMETYKENDRKNEKNFSSVKTGSNKTPNPKKQKDESSTQETEKITIHHALEFHELEITKTKTNSSKSNPTKSQCLKKEPKMTTKQQISQLIEKLRKKEGSIEEMEETKKKLLNIMPKDFNDKFIKG